VGENERKDIRDKLQTQLQNTEMYHGNKQSVLRKIIFIRILKSILNYSWQMHRNVWGWNSNPSDW